MRDPQALALAEEESRALLAAMQPYFAEDGITLHYEQPLRWLVQGEPLRGQFGSAPDRVIGRDVAPWLPASPLLRRLQNEMQMLLYTHAVNDARSARGALPVNSFWLHGTGAAGRATRHHAGTDTAVRADAARRARRLARVGARLAGAGRPSGSAGRRATADPDAVQRTQRTPLHRHAARRLVPPVGPAPAGPPV